MKVIRISAAPTAAVTDLSRMTGDITQLRTASGYWGRDANTGDVRVRQPAPPPPTTSTTTPRTSTTPTSTPSRTTTNPCDLLWQQLMGQADPAVRSCLNANTQHRQAFNQICGQIVTGKVTMAAGAAQWAGYVAQKCVPPAQQPPPPSVPTSPPAVPPDVIDVPTDAGGPGGGPVDQPVEDAGYLRQVGSLVGVGLILAVGLTYARKKGMLRKLTKRRHRR